MFDGYPTEGAEYGTEVDTADTSHVTGNQNTSRGIGSGLSVATYQWLIVVGALAGLWLLAFAFRSDIKVGGN